MRDIFQKSARTIVWLGMPTGAETIALELIDRCKDLPAVTNNDKNIPDPRYSKLMFDDSSWDTADSSVLSGPSFSEKLKSMSAFYSAPW